MGLSAAKEEEKFPFLAYNCYLVKERAKLDTKCRYCTPAYTDTHVIAFTKYWKIMFDINQSYLGKLLIVPFRHFATLDEATKEEMKEYRELLPHLFVAIQKSFDAKKYEIMPLNAVKTKEKVTSSHFAWLFVPRYTRTRIFNNEIYEDPCYDKPFDFSRVKNIDKSKHSTLTYQIFKQLRCKCVSMPE